MHTFSVFLLHRAPFWTRQTLPRNMGCSMHYHCLKLSDLRPRGWMTAGFFRSQRLIFSSLSLVGSARNDPSQESVPPIAEDAGIFESFCSKYIYVEPFDPGVQSDPQGGKWVWFWDLKSDSPMGLVSNASGLDPCGPQFGREMPIFLEDAFRWPVFVGVPIPWVLGGLTRI